MPAIETRTYYLDGPFPVHSHMLDTPEHIISDIVAACVKQPGAVLTFAHLHTLSPALMPIIASDGQADHTTGRFVFVATLPDGSDYCTITAIDTRGTTAEPY